ncbi:MAG: glycosyltransferase family 4 protein [Armatimonadetes bacterium]|nr:glycosyltransferase family 4 protein [Armatimonadota bacterium]MDW8153539.1 glycosyltransferase family 4 protein [Armatimonadota bacterium]
MFWVKCAMEGKPYYIFRDYTAEMERAVRQMVAGCTYDLVIIDTLTMTAYTEEIGLPRVLQEHNVEWYVVDSYTRLQGKMWYAYAGRREGQLIRRYEIKECVRSNAVVVLSEEDRGRLRNLGVGTKIEVIPPTVRTRARKTDGEEGVILYVGTGHWPPAADGIRWFLREVWPRIKRKHPSAEFWMAGVPPRGLKKREIPQCVRMLGYVEDLEILYQRAKVFIAPVRVGSGVRLKILHALARGLAVVSTSAGCEGTGAVDRVHMRIADTAEDFAEAVVEILKNRRLADQLGKAGQTLVQERFHPKVKEEKWKLLIEEVLAGRN